MRKRMHWSSSCVRTVTKYTTVRRPTENNNLESQYIDFIQNGKPLKDQPRRKMRRIDVAPKKD